MALFLLLCFQEGQRCCGVFLFFPCFFPRFCRLSEGLLRLSQAASRCFPAVIEGKRLSQPCLLLQKGWLFPLKGFGRRLLLRVSLCQSFCEGCKLARQTLRALSGLCQCASVGKDLLLLSLKRQSLYCLFQPPFPLFLKPALCLQSLKQSLCPDLLLPKLFPCPGGLQSPLQTGLSGQNLLFQLPAFLLRLKTGRKGLFHCL